MRFGLTLVLFSAISSSAVAAEQFNLQCTKQVRGSGVAEANTRTYRIDLEAKRWCMDDCKTALGIQAVTPDRITIDETDAAERNQASHYIYRGTGKYFQTYENRYLGTFIVTQGVCEPAPFTGLPSTKF